ncbi:hypothetical protein PR003_g32399 [Phytophthora rubi]|uniref:Uncharacterized protein n=1 Tax=Phytophthora rubi TaxID=129364 RepID=A0A6A3GVM6_9STRA|nr:hypothetical protein PR001_g30163 [Phytophthora rubi]KAE9265625.1 hypothetical protein PR003_g32399 [Phytophthora rubi]
MNVNLAVVVLTISTALDLIAFATSFIVQKRNQYWNVRSFASSVSCRTSSSYAVRAASRRPSQGPAITLDEVVKPVQALTTFEQHCLGSPFTKLFKDCDDFAYMAFVGKRCAAIEALLLTCYIFYGHHVYQAGSVVLLLMARPRQLLRTFNVLLILSSSRSAVNTGRTSGASRPP